MQYGASPSQVSNGAIVKQEHAADGELDMQFEDIFRTS